MPKHMSAVNNHRQVTEILPSQYVNSLQSRHALLQHHSRMCSSHSGVGSEHTTVGPPPLHVLVPE
jgi:hypothetical protein